ncbi:ADP-ribosylation factor GTPase-activating 2-like isoform X2 [Brachionus plicatilis]|uniref:ADP-ribosylation factor GTPase-activating 2-like isoform X2 n=1 Tax=Brachionus plicatilis TaxID=10195 RepID=A0A3M7RIJ5_BRAPC|nr:ADP-ribosylation factor GTPase-activating 2-like isoform X2 [Brachionus plicatilis]
MSSQEPTKNDVDTILKRVRSLASNKCCFDCGTKNPTWSSITYGILICIDCSATHRSLGVHVSFVKSTQLDVNWTWLQLRSMQVGGNANALAFFEQHNCTTKDSQQKYNSRAAQMYREKLHQLALKTQRTYGTKQMIDDGAAHPAPQAKSETDFFNDAVLVENTIKPVSLNPIKEPVIEDKSHEGPNVAPLISAESVQPSSQVKSSIMQKKPMQTKKKGLGAQKVNTDFKEIEKAISEQERLKEVEKQQVIKNKEEQEKTLEKQMASMKLAYNNLDKQREKAEEKCKSDPKKSENLERLGMAAGARGTGISHSAVSDMQIIQQDDVSAQSKKSSFFDDFEGGFSSKSSGFNSRETELDDMFRGFGQTTKSDWVVVDKFADETSNRTSSILTLDGDFKKASYSDFSSKTSSMSSSNGDASKRFANAKAISSEQYFGKNQMSESDINQGRLNRFQGSSAISSDDFFGDGQAKPKPNYNSTEIGFMKQDFKEGVTKVAGKLSNMASNVMSSLQIVKD